MTKGYHDSKTPESVRDLWRTPQALFDHYNDRFKFNCDIACSDENKMVSEDWITEQENALEWGKTWGGVNWCNPPYSNIMPWVDAIIAHREVITVLLVPADTSVKWFKKAFENCSECHLISGRLSFISEETGKPVSGNNKGSVVFVFDPQSPLKSQTVLIDRDEIMGS